MGRVRTVIVATVVGAALAAPDRRRSDHDHGDPADHDHRPTEPPDPPADAARRCRSDRWPRIPSHAASPKPKPVPQATAAEEEARTRRSRSRRATRRAPPRPAAPRCLRRHDSAPDRLRADRGAGLPDPDLLRRRRRPTTWGPPAPRSSPRSTRSRAASGRTSAPPRPGRWAGCSSCPRPGRPTASTRDSDGDQGPQRAARRDLRRGPLPARRRHAGGPRGRRLRLQPRRLVRRRGDGAGRLLQRDRQRRHRRPLPDPEAAGDGLLRRPRTRSVSIPRGLHEGLPGRGRPLRARAERRLGARGGGAGRVELRQGNVRPATSPPAGRSGSRRTTGSATRSTATATARSSTRAPPTPPPPSPG